MSKITYEYITSYLEAIEKKDEDIIEEIKKEAIKNNVPIIKTEVKQLLEVLLSIHKPNNILEIGTAVGYSAIIMSKYIGENGKITSIEKSDKMYEKAKENIKKAKKEKVINIINGDAVNVLEKLDGEYDIIFMDAAKGQYLTFLPHCLRLLKTGGILISDNVLQGGFVAKSRFSIPRRQRTIHQRMRQYIWDLNHMENLQTSILPISDGVTISYKLFD